MDPAYSIASHGPKDTSNWRQNGVATLLRSSNECQKQRRRLLQSAKRLVDFAFRMTAAQGTPHQNGIARKGTSCQKWRRRERMLQIIMIFSDRRHVWQISYSNWRRRRKRHAKTASQGKERHTKNLCIWSESKASNGFPTN